MQCLHFHSQPQTLPTFSALLYSCHRVAHRFYYRTHTLSLNKKEKSIVTNSIGEPFKCFCIHYCKTLIGGPMAGPFTVTNWIWNTCQPINDYQKQNTNTFSFKLIRWYILAKRVTKNFHLDWFSSIFVHRNVKNHAKMRYLKGTTF